MKITKLFILIASLVFIMTGCAPTVEFGDYYHISKTLPPKGKANIYIYNPYVEGISTGNTPTVCLDNKELIDLPNKAYFLVSVFPGFHEFGFLKETKDFSFVSNKVPQNTNTFHFNANMTYYIAYQRDVASDTETREEYTRDKDHPSYSTYTTTYPINERFALILSYKKASNDDYNKISDLTSCRIVKSLTKTTTQSVKKQSI